MPELDVPCLCSQIRRASRIVTAAYDDALRPSGLKITQFAIIQLLSTAGSLSQREIAQAMDLDATTLSRSLRPLLALGLIRDVRSADRRLRVVTLTPDGTRRLAAATAHWRSAQRRLRRKLGGPTWERLHDDLARVAATASTL